MRFNFYEYMASSTSCGTYKKFCGTSYETKSVWRTELLNWGERLRMELRTGIPRANENNRLLHTSIKVDKEGLRMDLRTRIPRETVTKSLQQTSIKLEEDMLKNEHRREKRGLIIALFILFLAVIVVGEGVLSILNRVDIDKTDGVLRSHIHNTQENMRLQEKVINETIELARINRKDIDLLLKAEFTRSTIEWYKPEAEFHIGQAIMGIRSAFNGKLTDTIASPTAIWDAFKNTSSSAEDKDLIYHDHPELFYELSDFYVSAVNELDMTIGGHLMIPMAKIQNLYIKAKVIPTGEFTPDMDYYTQPQVPPSIAIPLYPSKLVHNVSDLSSNVFYLDNAHCRQEPGVSVSLCQPWAMTSIPPTKHCQVPPNNHCPWNIHKVTPNYFNYQRIGSFYLIATNLRSYSETRIFTQNSSSRSHAVTKNIALYEVPLGSFYHFGSHVLGSFSTISVVDYTADFDLGNRTISLAPSTKQALASDKAFTTVVAALHNVTRQLQVEEEQERQLETEGI